MEPTLINNQIKVHNTRIQSTKDPHESNWGEHSHKE
jgi:hypothetical protein